MNKQLYICSGAKLCENHNCVHRMTHYPEHTRESCKDSSCDNDFFSHSNYVFECYCVPYSEKNWELLPTTLDESIQRLDWINTNDDAEYHERHTKETFFEKEETIQERGRTISWATSRNAGDYIYITTDTIDLNLQYRYEGEWVTSTTVPSSRAVANYLNEVDYLSNFTIGGDLDNDPE